MEAADAWTDFCDRLKAVGSTIVGDGFPSSPQERANGFRHLGGLVVHALQWCVDFDDPAFPVFLRSEDEVIRWGGPNTDNLYLRARVDPAGTYRVTADVSGLREAIISTHEGDMHLHQARVFEERNLSQLAVGADGELEVVLGPDRHEGNWVPLHPDVEHVLVRQYVSDWDHDVAVAFRIERLGYEGAIPSPRTEARVAAGLDRAARWIEASASFWNDYSHGIRDLLPANSLSPPRHPPGGAADIAYGGGWYELAPDEALVIECEVPEARYWSFQLLSPGWLECFDLRRMCSLNGHQVHVDDDGRFRVVVAHTDPGVQNWLDTEGLRVALLTYRWVFASSEPVPTATVVAVDDVRAALPASTPAFGAEQRRDQLARRQAAIARRFR